MLRQQLGYILSKLLSRIKHSQPKEILNSHCSVEFPIKELKKELIDSLLKDKQNQNNSESFSQLYM